MALTQTDLMAIAWLDDVGEVWRGGFGRYRPAGSAPHSRYIHESTIRRLIDFGYAERDPLNDSRVLRTEKKE